jgi:hypothetical protein
MRKRHLIILVALTLVCLSGCHKDKPVESQAPLETIAPETTSETISDKLDEPVVTEIPTIGTKDIDVEIESTNEAGETVTETVTEKVGIVETLAPEVNVETSSSEEATEVENLRPDVIVDSNQQVGVEAAKIEVDEDLDEEQMVAMDSIISYWQSEPRLGEDYLDYILANGSLSTLGDASKQKIKDTLMKYYPHTDTVPYEQLRNE